MYIHWTPTHSPSTRSLQFCENPRKSAVTVESYSGFESSLPDQFSSFPTLSRRIPPFSSPRGNRSEISCADCASIMPRPAPRSQNLNGKALYRRVTVFWWKSRLRLGSVSSRTIVRVSLRTAFSSRLACAQRHSIWRRMRSWNMMPALRRDLKVKGMPAL